MRSVDDRGNPRVCSRFQGRPTPSSQVKGVSEQCRVRRRGTSATSAGVALLPQVQDAFHLWALGQFARRLAHLMTTLSSLRQGGTRDRCLRDYSTPFSGPATSRSAHAAPSAQPRVRHFGPAARRLGLHPHLPMLRNSIPTTDAARMRCRWCLWVRLRNRCKNGSQNTVIPVALNTGNEPAPVHGVSDG
jgi:hypothetical protein